MRLRRTTADPAPSRWAYRLERLWLRPGLRAFVRRGLPALAVAAAVAAWGADGARRAAARAAWTALVAELRDRPEFLVRRVTVEGAGGELRAEIDAALSVELPVSRFALDVDALRAAVEALDPVRSARVRVLDGGVLSLEVIERVPAVAHLRAGVIDVLDAKGHPVTTYELIEELGDLPLISGDGAERAVPEALALLATAEPLRDRLVGLVRMGGRRWDVVLDGARDRALRILLPEEAPGAALDRALTLHAADAVLDRDVVALDLRLAGRPTLRMRPGAREAVAAARMRERSAEADE